MTQPFSRLAMAGILAAATLTASATPSAAMGGFLAKLFGPPPLTIQQMRELTPSCSVEPGPWLGRVSGNSQSTYYDVQRPVSLVGCFPTLKACTLWRMRMSGSMQGRIIYDQCEPR